MNSNKSAKSLQSVAADILVLLRKRYPKPPVNLVAENPWQQLVATILSAQCTDARVNMVTPDLFRRWPTPDAMASAKVEELENAIHSLGFYHAKAANILKTAVMLRDQFNGVVPHTMEELITLPGVARKTANVVLYTQFGINSGIAVDTHVKRIAGRLGLTKNTDPYKVEQDLMQLFPQKDWGFVNHALVLFGREVCTAKNPSCDICDAKSLCIAHNQNTTKKKEKNI